MAEDKKGGWKFALHESDDFEPDEFDTDDFDTDDFEDTEEETESANPLITTAVFLGLVVLAAIICWFLWNATHPDEEGGETVNQQDALQQDVESGEDVSGETTVDIPANDGEGGSDTDADADSKDTVGENADTFPEEDAQGPDGAAEEPVSGDETMEFDDVAVEVTAKDVINLRSKPSTLDSENIVAQLNNGEVIERIGINDITGWSKLMYNGQVVYAVSNYLTTDLTYRTPEEPANPNRITTEDGRVIIFVDVDNYVTPKQYVNLRTEPSTSQGDATVSCQITNGTVVHRTGYSADSGWSRVEHNGEVLYVVSSMVNGVEVSQ